MLYFVNLLSNLCKAQQTKLDSSTPTELQIADIYSEVVNNPYLKLFY